MFYESMFIETLAVMEMQRCQNLVIIPITIKSRNTKKLIALNFENAAYWVSANDGRADLTIENARTECLNH